MATILVMAGSLRAESYNKRLAAAGARALTAAGATVDLLDLREVAMPLYDGDLEDAEGLPEGAVAFRARLAVAQGFMIACPEYNSSIPGGFKNALDWASRGEPDVFDGKLVALMGASPGGFGSQRAHYHLRQVMTTLGVWALPSQVLVSRAHEAFTPEGELVNPRTAAEVVSLADDLVAALARWPQA